MCKCWARRVAFRWTLFGWFWTQLEYKYLREKQNEVVEKVTYSMK